MRKYYITELHTHTNPVSGCSDVEPKQLVNIYKKMAMTVLLSPIILQQILKEIQLKKK